MSNSPRTDAKLVEWDMQDLEFGHKFRELKEWAKQLESELCAALKLTNINTEAQLLKERDFHVMQLAAISTASIQNTEKSKLDRITAENDYCSQAYLDVCAAIDREMARRNERDDARKTCAELVADSNAITLAESLHRLEKTVEESKTEVSKLVNELRNIKERTRLALMPYEDKK